MAVASRETAMAIVKMKNCSQQRQTVAASFYLYYTRRKSKSQERSHHKSMVHFLCTLSAIGDFAEFCAFSAPERNAGHPTPPLQSSPQQQMSSA